MNVYGEVGSVYREAVAVMREEVYGDFKGDDAAKSAYEVLDVPAWKMLTDLGVNLSGEVAVNVDLYASEDKLVDDFRAWLKVTRSALGVHDIVRRLDKSDFGRWAQNRILAYLDLTLWAKVKGHMITNQVMGVALFPDEYNVNLAERIRKTVAPEASIAISTPYLEAMASQAMTNPE
ncbi:hypothetical protein E2553_00155 [Paraburkholderia dipogonis]|uniref:Uncharacterized protein n=1 Tax=Paraburkholderia dipogonis TaxID=1211383 RepID=A0A4Y8N1N7_9BURK|nr:DUF6387 family protein [Paraburkholderia dipogonis]TFE43582.1 hypothetical protein E2553_00155 [Paraburkholderia dipogonis]